MFYFFFFSSRRRHTRLTCDWSSDVCSSDLRPWCSNCSATGRPASRQCHWGSKVLAATDPIIDIATRRHALELRDSWQGKVLARALRLENGSARSEERRVGKGWRRGGGAGD